MKTMTIEAFLTWAFTQELCKVGAGEGDGPSVSSSWLMVSEVGTLGTLIDRSPNIFGVVPGFVADGDPHPDAIAAGEAVHGLADIGFEIPEGWAPFPDWPDEHGLVAREVRRVVDEVRVKGGRLSGRHLVALVTGAAILGRGPDWTADYPGHRMVMKNGQPAWFVMKKAKDAFGRVYEYEADGFNRVSQRPRKGAYRRFELKDMMRGTVLARLDWQLWQDALAVLADDLQGSLSHHAIAPFSADRQPWARVRKAVVSA
ncbi:MAG: hypothetical protein QMD99_03790 [Rhizobiaceae bacterium]|nr:hypothetical protein [Rhizobiaceae bacterium]